MSFSSDEVEVPDEHGLLIYMRSGNVWLGLEKDAHFPHIHKNCFAPASLKETRLLHGGGSGTAVFCGTHGTLGKVVGKHGHQGDTREVLALARIASELGRRTSPSQETSTIDLKNAANRMRCRIPEFVGIYISKRHLRNRTFELGQTMRHDALREVTEAALSGRTLSDEDSDLVEGSSSLSGKSRYLAEKKARRELKVVKEKHVSIDVYFRLVHLAIPNYESNGKVANGCQFLEDLTPELALQQESNFWKVTLFQKRIGANDAVNGTDVLASGNLVDDLLSTLLTEIVQVLDDLKTLTLPTESVAVDAVRNELSFLKEDRDVTRVSKLADSFCGFAIRKNFHPQTGRFATLRKFGQRFRDHSFHLLQEENVPANLLGRSLKKNCDFDKLFKFGHSLSALDFVEDTWLSLMELAAMTTSSSCTECIWTCGLTDAGLHNTFLSRDRGLELFDLGEPSCMPKPAFLTKFLMSFFHTLGMHDNPNETDWVIRFSVDVTGEVDLTSDTKAVLPSVCGAFRSVLDHFVEKVFNGDSAVLPLLIKYVVLQLLSDAAFCLERWERKGGGQERIGEEIPLQKWLWRALWDIFAASFVLAEFGTCF